MRISRPEKERTAATVSKSSGSAMASVRVESGQRQRKGAALAQEAVREAVDFGRGGRRLVHRDQRHAELLGERRQHVALRDQPHVDQDLAELVAALALQFERAFEVFRLDLAALDEHLAQAHGARACAGGAGGVRVGVGSWRSLIASSVLDVAGQRAAGRPS